MVEFLYGNKSNNKVRELYTICPLKKQFIMQIQKMKIGYMKWFGNKLKVKCPYCCKEFTFTLKEITYGFLYPESIKCKFCDNFIELKDGVK
jgi:hypothetical protein